MRLKLWKPLLSLMRLRLGSYYPSREIKSFGTLVNPLMRLSHLELIIPLMRLRHLELIIPLMRLRHLELL